MRKPGSGRVGAGRAGMLALGLAACAGETAQEAAPAGTGIALVFEEVEAPDALRREGIAERDRPDGAPGLWAAVPGLSRPERARISNPATGAAATVALFRAPAGDGTIRLSVAAAEALGIGPGARAPVAIVALRREPRLIVPDATDEGF